MVREHCQRRGIQQLCIDLAKNDIKKSQLSDTSPAHSTLSISSADLSCRYRRLLRRCPESAAPFFSCFLTLGYDFHKMNIAIENFITKLITEYTPHHPAYLVL